jgi:flavodoxin/Pyruvate/2-oxoacid:ferredoxin oxidoreductase delta subunit
MKCIIIYYSQTGNTEKIAKAIQIGVKRAAGNCDILPIKEASPRRLEEYDLIGIGAPVFGIEPLNVEMFVKDMRFVGGKHAFAFNTHGTHPEVFFPSLIPKLKERGLVVIGMREWYGACYLTHMPKPYATDGHPDETDLKEALEFGKEMVERSQRIAAGETGLIPPVPVAPPEEDPQNFTIPKEDEPRLGGLQDMVKYHQEKCLYPKCRLCMDNCPVDAIDLTMNPPVITQPCAHCELCFRICPTGAMEGDAHIEYMIKNAASRDVCDNLLFPPLARAEAEGKFRRLVPYEEIGWENYPHLVYKKHPYWVMGKGPRWEPEKGPKYVRIQDMDFFKENK